tara:strand:+ start:153 stop:422 length:270 start_codon:yes stop_codon:yes gene_type:complete
MSEIVCPLECVKSGCPSDPDFLEKHSTFVITMGGMISACIASIFAYFLKSRCSKIKTPCLSCDRTIPETVVEPKEQESEDNNNDNSNNI